MQRILISLAVVAAGYIAVQTAKRKNCRKQMILTAVSICYGAGLIYFTFLSRVPGDSRINIFPFFTVLRSLRYPVRMENIRSALQSGQWELVFTTLKPIENAVLNVVLFIPFGFLLLEWKPQMKPGQVLLAGLLLSGSIEIIQRLTWLGWFDVDDLLCNFFGSVLGVLLFIAGSWTGWRDRI